MINEVIIKLKDKISAIIQGSVDIRLANISKLHEEDNFIDGKNAIIMSIVNIEEDKTLKNQSLYEQYNSSKPTRDKYKKPAQNLVFSILFSSYIKDGDLYMEGISKLEQVIQCLQNNNVFYYDNLGNFYEWQEVDFEKKPELKNELNKLIIDLVSLKSEQLNQMWSYLGSKYMPSVLYTMRLVRIQNETLTSSAIIKQVETQLWNNNKEDSTGGLEEGTFVKI